MAVTVHLFNISDVVRYGIIQKDKTVAFAGRNPFYLTLRSVGIASTTGGYALLRGENGTYSSAGANELSTGNGYTKGGKALQNVRVNYASGELTMAADDVGWSATGSGIAARSALLCYELPQARSNTNASLNDPYTASIALALIDFDALLTASNGTAFTVQWPSAGIFKFTMA
jgi:hypothetical protein